MKKIIACLGFVFAAGLASAASSIVQGGTVNPDQSTVTPQREGSGSSSATDSENKQRSSQSSATDASAEPEVLDLVVVSVDPAAHTITVREILVPNTKTDASAPADATARESVILPVEGKAYTKLSGLKAGDQVRVTCRESADAAPRSKRRSRTPSNEESWDRAKSGDCAAVTDVSKSRSRSGGDSGQSETDKNR